MRTVRGLICVTVLLAAAATAAAVDETPDAVETICPNRLLLVRPEGALTLACQWSKPFGRPEPAVRRAIIVIHGVRRDAYNYYTAVRRLAADLPGAETTTLILAPQFLTEADLEAHAPEGDPLFWTSSGWKYGDRSLSTEGHARPASVSSFAVVDRIMETLAEGRLYPRLKEVVVAGHSAGGQFVNRYAAGGRGAGKHLAPKRIAVRYVVANPSSFLYLTPERHAPGAANRFAVPQGPPGYNRYPYGLGGLNAYMAATGRESILNHMRERHVIYLCGAEDDDPDSRFLDTRAAAMLQGTHRWERAVLYHNHLRDVLGPRISLRHKFLQIPDVGHRARDMFRSAAGVRYLFGRTAR